MTDLITRLRTWSHARHAVPASDLMDEAADAIEKLRDANLTDAEREAVAYFAAFHRSPREGDAAAADTLRGLLSRTGSDLRQTGDNAAECHSQSEKTPERERLAYEEREAVRFCVTASLPETEKLGGVAGGLCRMHAARLRSLLERLG